MEVLFCNSKSVQIFGTNLTETPLDKAPEISLISFAQLYENSKNFTVPRYNSQPLSMQDLILKQQDNEV